VISLYIPGANWASTKMSGTNYQVTVSGFSLIEEDMMSLTFSVNYVNDTPIVQLIALSEGGWRTTDRSDLYWVMDDLYEMYSDMHGFGW